MIFFFKVHLLQLANSTFYSNKTVDDLREDGNKIKIPSKKC